jgi:hypothetical protein
MSDNILRFITDKLMSQVGSVLEVDQVYGLVAELGKEYGSATVFIPTRPKPTEDEVVLIRQLYEASGRCDWQRVAQRFPHLKIGRSQFFTIIKGV